MAANNTAPEEEPPEDIDDIERYIRVPHKHDFDLGKPLVMKFVEHEIPEAIDAVYEIFRKKGAYSRYKSLLVSRGLLDAWHAFEEQARKEALKQWYQSEGIVLV